MFRTIAIIAFLILLGSAAPQAQQAPVQPSPVKRTIHQKAEVPGTNLEVIYATVEIAPGFEAGRQSHPGVVMAQVIPGEFGFHPTASPRRFSRSAKHSTVPDRAIHNEGATDKGVKINVVYVVEKGQPLASPAK